MTDPRLGAEQIARMVEREIVREIIDKEPTMTTTDFLTERRTGLGGTDMAPVLRVKEHTFGRTPFSVWLEKTGRADDKEVNEAMEWGTRLESPVADKYAEVTGRTLTNPEGVVRHKKHGCLIAHPDRYADDGGLECKTAGTDGKAWGPEGSPRIPEAYRVQIEHYMLVTGRPWWDLAVPRQPGQAAVPGLPLRAEP